MDIGVLYKTNQHFQTPSTHLTRRFLIPMYHLNIEQRYIAPKSLIVDLWSDIIAMVNHPFQLYYIVLIQPSVSMLYQPDPHPLGCALAIAKGNL